MTASDIPGTEDGNTVDFTKKTTPAIIGPMFPNDDFFRPYTYQLPIGNRDYLGELSASMQSEYLGSDTTQRLLDQILDPSSREERITVSTLMEEFGPWLDDATRRGLIDSQPPAKLANALDVVTTHRLKSQSLPAASDSEGSAAKPVFLTFITDGQRSDGSTTNGFDKYSVSKTIERLAARFPAYDGGNNNRLPEESEEEV